MKIKVCGLKDRENILSVEMLLPDLTGYIFYNDSPRNMRSSLPPKNGEASLRTGVFVNSSIEEITKMRERYALDFVQLHGNENPEFCRILSEQGIKIIKAFHMDHSFDDSLLQHYKNSCHYFLFDTRGKKFGGNGRKFNWHLLQAMNPELPFFLGGGIGPDDAERIIQFSLKNKLLCGIDLNSGFEIEPGIKDVNLLGKFISQIRKQIHSYEI